MPRFFRRQAVEASREVPRPLYRLFDRKQHFLGLRDDQKVLIYCEQCAVFVVVKPPLRGERITASGGGHHP
jgi:hypothetical protein